MIVRSRMSLTRNLLAGTTQVRCPLSLVREVDNALVLRHTLMS